MEEQRGLLMVELRLLDMYSENRGREGAKWLYQVWGGIMMWLEVDG